MFLCARNLFVKKKINRLEIVRIASFYHTTHKIEERKTQRLHYKIVEGKNQTTAKKDSAEISDTTLRGLTVTTSAH